MRLRLVLLGGGGHARVVIEAVRSRPELFDLAGFSDPGPAAETQERLGVRRLGVDEDALRLVAEPDVAFVLGLAGTRVDARRRDLVARFEARAARWAAVVHASALISPTARVEDGAFVGPGAILNAGARVGRHCVVNSGALLEHDVVVEDFAQIAPAAAVGGGTRVGADSYIGLGARIRDHVVIGRTSTVGMGAVVVSDVADRATVMGVPARPREGR